MSVTTGLNYTEEEFKKQSNIKMYQKYFHFFTYFYSKPHFMYTSKDYDSNYILNIII